jgi:hypothetical protein
MEYLMLGESYRLNKSTIAIILRTNIVPVSFPKDAVITIIAGPLNGNRIVDVKWEKLKVMMFAEDIRERGTLLQNE